MRPEVRAELDRISSLKSPLEQLGYINPEDHLKTIDEKLARMEAMMKGDGINVQAKNG